MNTMGSISASTNFNCTDCHVEPKVEGDWECLRPGHPRKVTAWRMILMVQAINKTNFGGARVVTCYTCHRTGFRWTRPQDHAEPWRTSQ